MEDNDFMSFGLADVNGMLTNAGALLADEPPINNVRLFCTKWHGLNKASGVMEAEDDKEFTGSIITLLQSAEEFIKNNTKNVGAKLPMAELKCRNIPKELYWNV